MLAFTAGFLSLGSSALWGQLILYAGEGGERGLFCVTAGVIATPGQEGAGLCSSFSFCITRSSNTGRKP